jgi:hypothetical protein
MGVAGFYLITADGDVGTGVVYVPPEVYLNACQPCGYKIFHPYRPVSHPGWGCRSVARSFRPMAENSGSIMITRMARYLVSVCL